MIIKLAASTLDRAKHELDLIGMTANNKDEMNREMRKNILDIIKTFSKQGHSGFSAKYAIDILTKLLDHKPLSPLTGKESEWKDISEMSNCKNGDKLFQNIRYSSVFKKIKNGKTTYNNINGIVFTDKNGFSYTSSKSSVPVKKFPYTPKTEYKKDTQ